MKLKFEPELRAQSLAKLGFGTWGLGGSSYGLVSEVQASQLISYAYGNGIRLFDTSPLYGDGRSEKILGNTLKEYPRSTYTIITKAGLYNSGSEEMRDFSESAISNSLAESLERLRINHIDYFLLHSPTSLEINCGKVNNFGLGVKISDGTIGNFGVSLKSPADYFLVDDMKSIQVIEFNYSLMDQRAGFMDNDDEKIKSLFKIARTPYNFGFLTDSPPGKRPPASPLKHLSNWPQKQFDVWHASRKVWERIGKDNNLSLQDLALSFVLSSDFVDLVIPGFMNTGHILSAIDSANRGPLTKESRDSLTQIYLENESKFVVSK